ncbi:CARDB domain-containing protein [Nocardioides panacisoli]|uniref:CARDB domain-containing protein n=1 Tax=Nocardioides panacisoli TaxID=627624 RepID=A0ABP7IPV5_9ACTN
MARSLRLLACAALAAALTVPAGAGASAEGHAKKADLVVASVRTPASVEAGTAAAVRVKVHNGGKAKASASVVRLALSTDRTAGGDTALKPTLAVPSLSPGGSWSGKVSVNVPASAGVGSYYVIACADAKRRVAETNEINNCKVSSSLAVSAPMTSHDLIDADVASGTLTEEQGLVYKVFSDFGDPRLPGKYAGATNGVEEGALPEAAESWDTLSPATQDTLRPFLIPAFYPGSHWTPATPGRAQEAGRDSLLDSPWCSGYGSIQPAFESWGHEDTTDGSFRVWWLKKYPGDETLAKHIADVLEKRILPELSDYMGHTIKPDGGSLCGGGSDAIDIALVDTSTAETFPDGGCDGDGTSTHMFWPRTKPAPWAGIDPYLAHEVLHMIQFGMPSASGCQASSWLREMTAEWIQDYATDPLYPVGLAPDDTEHLSSTLYFQRPDVSLDATKPAGHDYGSYLFPLFEARHGDVDFVRHVWENAGSLQPTEAVNAALPGDGFNAVWPEFALALWNQDPVHDFKDWDQLSEGARTVGTQGIAVGTHHPKVHVEHLATKYLALDFDKGVTEIEVTNDQAGEKDASLQAVIEYDDGSTKVVNLSDEPTTTICIDDGTKRVTSVVLIFGNANQTAPIDFAPTVEGKASCGCPDVAPKAASRAGATCTGNITFSWTEDTTDEKPEGVVGRTHETGGGTLGLAFESPTSSDPGTFWVDPASTYELHRTWHSESYRDCGTETGDVSDAGSGHFDDQQTFAVHDPDATGSDEVGVSLIFVLPVTATKHFASECTGQSSDEVTPDHWGVPGCPPKTGGNFWWKFDPVSPGSDDYRISCSGTVEWEDGLGKHVLTSTVSGTITLP